MLPKARKPSTINVRENYIGIIANNTGREFIFDKEMLCVLNGRAWSESPKGYLQAWYPWGKEMAHHFVIGKPLNGFVVDHINRDSLINLRGNMRVIKHAQNRLNCGIRCTNKSGFKGVHFRPKTNKWQATIRINGSRKHIGYFNSPQEAAKAFDDFANKHNENILTNKKLGVL